MTKALRKTPRKSWHVYVLRCQDGSLYTGVTKDVARRFREHQTKGSRYTRSHLPVCVAHTESFRLKTSAYRREAQIKSWPRKKKLELLSAAPSAPDRAIWGPDDASRNPRP